MQSESHISTTHRDTPASLGPSSPEMDLRKVKTFPAVHISKCFGKWWICCTVGYRGKGPPRQLPAQRRKARLSAHSMDKLLHWCFITVLSPLPAFLELCKTLSSAPHDTHNHLFVVVVSRWLLCNWRQRNTKEETYDFTTDKQKCQNCTPPGRTNGFERWTKFPLTHFSFLLSLFIFPPTKVIEVWVMISG